MNTATFAPGNRDIRTVTVGLFRSCRKGEILLVYLNDGTADATVMLYDQLSGKDRHLVRVTAQDPLRLLNCSTFGPTVSFDIGAAIRSPHTKKRSNS